eukprot:GEMP01022482.1.p1 GENE.GEMP01022482.1~~GEMP01022482.1.p1  ORF type:complete len:753 (+),score=158.21 GEMP01022482.1:88-2346(+)
MRPPPWYVRDDLVPPALERADKLEIFGYRPATTSTDTLKMGVRSANIPEQWWGTCPVPSTLARLMEDICQTVPLLLRDMAAASPNPEPHFERLSTAIQLMVNLLATRSRQEECRILLAEELRQRGKDLSELAFTMNEYLDLADERKLTEEHLKIIKSAPSALRKPEELKRGYHANSPVTQCLICLQYFVEKLSEALRKIVSEGAASADVMATELSKVAQDFLRRCKKLPSLPGGDGGTQAAGLTRELETARELVIKAERQLQVANERALEVYKTASEELYEPFGFSPPPRPDFFPTDNNMGKDKERVQEPWRLACEAEFVQCLASPIFLREMLKYLADVRFQRFLRYLTYWYDRRYSLLLAYPVCLQTLELLTIPQCASALCCDAQAALEVDLSIFRQWAQTQERGISRSLWCSDNTQAELPPDLLGQKLRPPDQVSLIDKIRGPPLPHESLTEAATYAGQMFFQGANSVTPFGDFKHVYTSCPLSGNTASLWKFDEVPPIAGPIDLSGIEAPTTSVLIDYRLPTPPRERRGKQPEGEFDPADSRQRKNRKSSRGKKVKPTLRYSGGYSTPTAKRHMELEGSDVGTHSGVDKRDGSARTPEASSSVVASPHLKSSGSSRKIERHNTASSLDFEHTGVARHNTASSLDFDGASAAKRQRDTPRTGASRKKRNILDGKWRSSLNHKVTIEVRDNGSAVFFDNRPMPHEVKYDIGEKRYHWGGWMGVENHNAPVRTIIWESYTNNQLKIVWTELQ